MFTALVQNYTLKNCSICQFTKTKKKVPFQKICRCKLFHCAIVWLPSQFLICKICTLCQAASPHPRQPLLATKPRIQRPTIIYNPFPFGIVTCWNWNQTTFWLLTTTTQQNIQRTIRNKVILIVQFGIDQSPQSDRSTTMYVAHQTDGPPHAWHKAHKYHINPIIQKPISPFAIQGLALMTNQRYITSAVGDSKIWLT